ncbi:hypothetical protein INR75_01995 [Zunongwangia sp. SCSIO 43204]|uniref:hypothetical protein n=1 Tax=Zunongwangia sp. SCSIO 43204 TaxID=2779359 RepID=UPI001CA81BE2|nr:hypothetical protein [Zunongwangia sp. SCSIO 43204]UAB84823.1 hypothetical protein INR75_01995 [Zunongwangia sp. SCSIO 43204]
MEDLNKVFQTDSKDIQEFYQSNSNYIVQTDENSLKNLAAGERPFCAIYFSSHDIYYPNNSESFYQQVVRKNRFEWYRTRVQKAQKHIFLRDIKKQWYLAGINHELNSIEMVLAMLKEETAGFDIVTIGSSAGGYAAMLFGQFLNANYSLSFNGQSQVFDLLKKSKEEINPILFRERNNNFINKYFSIKKFINNPEKIFYFYSNNSPWDVIQYEHIKNISINFVSYSTSHHGIPFVKSSLPKVINLDKEDLEKLSGKTYNPILFSVKMDGSLIVMRTLYFQIVKKLKRKLNF